MATKTLTGQFAGLGGTVWGITIEKGEPLGAPAKPDAATDTLVFGAEPLIIESSETEAHESVCGSSATLTVESPGDRDFVDLYNVEPATRLTVRRNGAIYWQGYLDGEQYEEPYSRTRNYDVVLTFSDFGTLKRCRFDGSGLVSVADIIAAAARQSGITTAIDTSLVDIDLQRIDIRDTLQALQVDARLFYENDEADSMADVLEAVLVPLGLRIAQCGGRVWVYSLAGLQAKAARQAVEWDGTDAVLKAGKVYRKATIEYKPTEGAKIGSAGIDEKKVLAVKDDSVCEDIYPAYVGDKYNGRLDGFRLRHARPGTAQVQALPSNLEIFAPAHVFRMDALWSNGGQGIGALMFAAQPDGSTARDTALLNWETNAYDAEVKHHFNAFGTPISYGAPTEYFAKCMALRTGYVAGKMEVRAAGGDPDKFKLRVCLSTLFDPRTNPFEDAKNMGWTRQNCNGGNAYCDGDYFDNMNERANYCYVPVRLFLLNEKGEKIFYLANHCCFIDTTPIAGLVEGIPPRWAEWREMSQYTQDWEDADRFGDAEKFSHMLLAYYDTADRKKKGGMGGWAKNKPYVTYRETRQYAKTGSKLGDGDIIPLPPVGGTLLLEVCGCVFVNESGINMGDCTLRTKWPIAWVAFKDPEIEVINADGADLDEDNSGAFEYSAILNERAQDDIDLTFDFGVPSDGYPGVFGGIYHIAETPVAPPTTLHTFRRAGQDLPPEDHLFGLMASQYSTPRLQLDGTAKPLHTLCVLTERANPGKGFFAQSTRYDCRADCSEISLIELKPIEYNVIEKE